MNIELARSKRIDIWDLLTPYFSPRILKMGFLWVWGGVPFMITGSTMAVWLKEYGISYTTIGLFSFLHLPYALRFLWSPVIDHIHIPYLSEKFGQQRAWMLVVQCTAFLSLLSLSQISPIEFPFLFIALSFFLTISAATSDMILLAYQIQILPSLQWGVGESTGFFCYRVGMLFGGACALALSNYFSWASLYFFFGIFLIGGPFVVLALPESSYEKKLIDIKTSFFRKALLAPFQVFVSHPGWWSVLIFMFLFRLQDNLIGSMPSLFYLDLGFSKGEIANCQKVFGMWMSVLGGVLGGTLLRSHGYVKTLWIGGISHGLSGFCYLVQTWGGASLPLLYTTTALEDLSKGIAIIAFFSYQLTCCKKEYAVTQLALLTSLTHLSQVSISSLSGFFVDILGWKGFFTFTTIAGFLGILWIKFLPALFETRERDNFKIH